MLDEVVLDNLKPLFQLDHQTHINLYLTKPATLPYCSEITFDSHGCHESLATFLHASRYHLTS